MTGTTSDDEGLVDLRCSIIILRGEAVLLLHREAAANPDWVLPGGRPREGESTAACARREVTEETGLHVDPGRVAFVLEVTDPRRRQRTVELVFLGTLQSDADGLSGEPGKPPSWVPLSELSALNLYPPIGGYISGLARHGHQTAAYLGNMWRPPASQ